MVCAGCFRPGLAIRGVRRRASPARAKVNVSRSAGWFQTQSSARAARPEAAQGCLITPLAVIQDQIEKTPPTDPLANDVTECRRGRTGNLRLPLD